MIDNIIYGLGTVGFVFLCVLILGAIAIVLLATFVGMTESIKELFEGRKRGKL